MTAVTVPSDVLEDSPDREPAAVSSPPVTTKQRILQAAEEVVLRDGVGHLTLDAAAAQAGLSKGGVLYHYPTRAALVSAMVTKIIDEFQGDIDDELTRTSGPGSFTRAYLRATIPADVDGVPDHQDRVGAAVIAAAAAEPELLAPLQEAFQRWQAALAEDGLDPVVATVVRLASDGLWLCDLFGLGAPERLQRRELRTTLERLTEVAR
jgi:AcrR family transcriptional regulator